MHTTDHRPASTTPATCDDGWTPTHVTRSLLGWGVVAGPFYVVVSLAQALTRDGFDLDPTPVEPAGERRPGLGAGRELRPHRPHGRWRMPWACGRALAGGPGGRWAPVLTGIFGAGLVAAGVLRADPALGFPVGTPDGPGPSPTHGILHFAAAGVGFVAVAAAASCWRGGSPARVAAGSRLLAGHRRRVPRRVPLRGLRRG